MDGGQTSVDWAPDFLFIDKHEISPLKNVIQDHAGLYWYEKSEALAALVNRFRQEPEEEDIRHLRYLYENPGVNVIGVFGQAMVDDHSGEVEVTRPGFG